MFHSHARCLVATLLIWGTLPVFAQTSSTSNPTNGRENNPYSKFGIGELSNGSNAVLRGMASMTSAYEHPYITNPDNPASYSFLERTTFEGGAMASTRNIVAPGLSYTTGTATLAYLNIGVPVNKNAGLAFGFRPYTHVYYSMQDTLNTASGSPIGQVIRYYNGEGGLNSAYIGGAYRYKEISVGFNLCYLFGTIRNTTAAIPDDSLATNRAYTTEFTNYNRIGGLYWKGGAIYKHKLDSNYTIRIGGTLSMSQNVNERLNAFQIASYDFRDSLIRDTASYPGEQKGKLKLPLSFSIGVTLARNDKWNVGIDYSSTQWSSYNSSPDTSLKSGIANQAYKLRAGGEYTPDAANIRNYFSRVTYRMGLYYGTDYIRLENTTLPVYGITVGASLPFRRSLSRLSMAMDIGRLGTTTNNLLQQNYMRFTIGTSFNDKWFIPRKYD